MKRRDKHQWMLDRVNDPYFVKAKKEGYRARSAYKLIEIQQKFKIVPRYAGCNILDLGCAPGAWLQVLRKLTEGSIFGIDLIDIRPLPGVSFLKADIFSSDVENFIKGLMFDLIISDIAPNCSGVKEHDHLQIMYLAEYIFHFAILHLKTNATFCIKLFDGRDVVEFVRLARNYFKCVKFFKPKSSHRESNEFYLVCSGFGLK